MKLRRSLLWVSGYDLEKLKKAVESPVDAIVLDLEDGVTVKQKPEARAGAAKALREWDFRGKERIVRVNGLDTPYFRADLNEVLVALPDAVRLPKCESVEYVMEMDRILAEVEQNANLAIGTIELILMLETPAGIMHCYDMASCCQRVTAVGIGMEDLTASMGVSRNYELGASDLLYARQKMILEAKAAGVQVLDSGVLFSGDPDYMLADTLRDKRDGFDGRSLSDITHAQIVNDCFSPSKEEVNWAKRVILAYEEAALTGKSDVTVDGKFVDPPVVAKAERIEIQADMIRKK